MPAYQAHGPEFKPQYFKKKKIRRTTILDVMVNICFVEVVGRYVYVYSKSSRCSWQKPQIAWSVKNLFFCGIRV
jgi:hypothetical protein